MNSERYSADVFAKNMVFLRGKASKKTIANQLGICINTLSYYEKGERKSDIEMLARICNHFNISPAILLSQDLATCNGMITPIDKVLQGNRTLTDPNILNKFENITLYVYYYSGSRINVIREGTMELLSRYKGKEFVAGEFRSYSQSYYCKLIVEGNDNYYIFGTNMDRPDRMVMSFCDHQFLTTTDKLRSGVGLCLSLSSRGRNITQVVILSSIKLQDNPDIPDGNDVLKQYLSMSHATDTGFILSSDTNANFEKWLLQYTTPRL